MNDFALAAMLMLMLTFGFACCVPLGAEPYRLPPQGIVDLVDSAPSPLVDFSPDNEWMVMLERDAMPSIDDVSRRMLRLAGIRIDPAANMRFQTAFRSGMMLRRRRDGPNNGFRIPLPAGSRLANVSWCHDSQKFAFVVVTKTGSELWYATVENPGAPVRLTDRLCLVLEGFHWLSDGEGIICVQVPDDRGDEPVAVTIPVGPNVQTTTGNKSPTRTYQDLLQNVHDEDLFRHYATGQISILGLDGTETNLGEPSVVWDVEPSPDGNRFLVTTIARPYSYLLTVASFPQEISVWNKNGEREHEVAKIPLAENIPIQGVRLGPRQVTWQTGRPATLVWCEALDGGDPNQPAPHRDRWYRHAAPFASDPTPLFKIEHRAIGLSFLNNPDHVISVEYDRDRRWVRTLLQRLDQPDSDPIVLTDRSIRDRYGDPGRTITVPDDAGHEVVLQHGPWVYRVGAGASPEGMLPFLDRQNIDTLTTERLWRCQPGSYESVVAIVGGEKSMLRDSPSASPSFITTKQSPVEPPNYFLHDNDNGDGDDSGDGPTPLTTFPNPTPQVQQFRKQLVTYEREDGVPLSATLYLPANYAEGTRLPLLVWAYPVEFNDSATAGQVGSSPWTFTRIRGSSHLALLASGYAIMDGATIPIIGDPETMNDTFVSQLVTSAKAAIDKAVDMGVADRHRVAVGGHSYGAFMTANLLAQCDLFQAGIARSGAYNRTLTPFGFQSERRPLWEAKDVYFNVSPFMHADKISDPLLLIHGEEDNNSGTFPMQSQRLFQAIKGNGGTARLVMLPKESHGYRARESVLHVQAEMLEWLDKHVKQARVDSNSEDNGNPET